MGPKDARPQGVKGLGSGLPEPWPRSSRDSGSYRVWKSVSYRVCNFGSLEDGPSTATGGRESGRYRGRAGRTAHAFPPRPGSWWSPSRGRSLRRPGGRASRRGTWGPWSWSTPRGVHGGVRGPRGEHPGPPGPRRGGGGASEGPRPPSGQDRLRGLFFRPGKLPVSGWSPGSRDVGGELAFWLPSPGRRPSGQAGRSSQNPKARGKECGMSDTWRALRGPPCLSALAY
jgi:hypothetical protein